MKELFIGIEDCNIEEFASVCCDDHLGIEVPCKILCCSCGKMVGDDVYHIKFEDSIQYICERMPDNERADAVRELLDVLYELFDQACRNGCRAFNHDHISAYEEAQRLLIKYGIVLEEECVYA